MPFLSSVWPRGSLTRCPGDYWNNSRVPKAWKTRTHTVRRAEGWRLMQARDGRTWRACQERNRIGSVRPLSSAQRLVDGLDGRGSARCGENIDSGNVGLFCCREQRLAERESMDLRPGERDSWAGNVRLNNDSRSGRAWTCWPGDRDSWAGNVGRLVS